MHAKLISINITWGRVEYISIPFCARARLSLFQVLSWVSCAVCGVRQWQCAVARGGWCAPAPGPRGGVGLWVSTRDADGAGAAPRRARAAAPGLCVRDDRGPVSGPRAWDVPRYSIE